MPSKPYPSNLIIFDLDERVFSENMKLALIRSWVHIGQTLVHTHAGNSESEPVNFMHVMVKFGTRHYLYSKDDGADENWDERMEQHLLATMRKISNNNIAFNRTQRRLGEAELTINYLEFELEGGALTLEFLLDSNGALPLSCAGLATEVREQLNAGKLGKPVRVRVPSKASYVVQAQAAAEQRAAEEERAAQAAAAEAAAKAAAQEEEPEADFEEEPALVEEFEQEQEEAAAVEDSPLEVRPMTEEEWQANYGVLEPLFALDYRTAEAIYSDGSSAEFTLARAAGPADGDEGAAGVGGAAETEAETAGEAGPASSPSAEDEPAAEDGPATEPAANEVVA